MKAEWSSASVLWSLLVLAVVSQGAAAPEQSDELRLSYEKPPGPVTYLFLRTRERGSRRIRGADAEEKIKDTDEEYILFTAAHSETTKEGWIKLLGRSFSLKQDPDYWGALIDKTGRHVDKRGTSGYQGSWGRGRNPLPLFVFRGLVGFPWLPDMPVKVGDTWEETVKVGEFAGPGWGPLFPVAIRWRFVSTKDVKRYYHRENERFTTRKCAEIEFEFEGTHKLSENETVALSGKGRWLFDIEHGLDVLVEKEVTWGPVVTTDKGKYQDFTRYITKKVLSENVLITPGMELPAPTEAEPRPPTKGESSPGQTGKPAAAPPVENEPAIGEEAASGD